MTREQRLARVFVELADTLVAEFDVIDFLHTLADRSVELLETDAAGLLLADQRGRLRVIASSSASPRLTEAFELQDHQGPSFDCFQTGERVVNLDESEMEARWPGFWTQASELGLRSAHALPMRLRDEVIGAVTLLGFSRSTLSEDDIAVGQAMADVATIGLLQERSIHQSMLLAEQLQTALSSRVLIEQAKGVLAERARLSVDEAFVVMRTYAREKRRSLPAVATGILDRSLSTAELQEGRMPEGTGGGRVGR